MYLGVDARFRLCHTSLTAKGEARLVSVSGEDIVQSSDDFHSENGLPQTVIASDKHANAGLNHFLHSPGLSLNECRADCEHKSRQVFCFVFFRKSVKRRFSVQKVESMAQEASTSVVRTWLSGLTDTTRDLY